MTDTHLKIGNLDDWCNVHTLQGRRNIGESAEPIYLYHQPSIQSQEHPPESQPQSHLPTPQDLPSQQDPHLFRLQCEELVENMISSNSTLEKSDNKNNVNLWKLISILPNYSIVQKRRKKCWKSHLPSAVPTIEYFRKTIFIQKNL